MAAYKVVFYLVSITGVGYGLMKIMESSEVALRKELASREDRNSLTENEKKRKIYMDALKAAAESKHPIYIPKPVPKPAPKPAPEDK